MADRSEDAALYFIIGLAGIAFLQWWRSVSAQGASTRQAGSFFPGNPMPGQQPSPLIEAIAPMHVSENGQAFIKANETLRLRPYPDAGGFSIGWGHHYPAGVQPPPAISQSQADTFFADDIHTVEATLNNALKVNVTQNQFDALADFVFNVGPRNFENSTLLRMVNNGNFTGAAGQFAQWRLAQGQVNQNLVNRRQREANLFSEGPSA